VAKKRLFVLPKYPSSIASMSFNHDGTLLVRYLCGLKLFSEFFFLLTL
jgi:anaerobic C4-dicarboxylate transporter